MALLHIDNTICFSNNDKAAIQIHLFRTVTPPTPEKTSGTHLNNTNQNQHFFLTVVASSLSYPV